MVTPVIYFILFSIIDDINKLISSTLPVLPNGNFFSYSDISPTRFFNLSVPMGPGAIFTQLISLLAYCLVNNFNTLENAIPVSYTHLTLPTNREV